jgi:F-type H+-transporting ATPase subunit b
MSYPFDLPHSPAAARCGSPPRRFHVGVVVAALVMLGALAGAGEAQDHGSAAAASQAGQAAPDAAAGEHATAQGEHGEAGAEHGESLFSFLSRIANFLILAGGLYYLLRTPLSRYLDARGQQIRSDLEQAAVTRATASRRLADIEAQVQKLPGEIEALKARGKEEVAAEQARMARSAEAERSRLVEQVRREIDRQLQIARQDLTEHAADLAVGVARARLAQELTPEEQLRLVDRYVTQVGGRHE